MSTEVKSAQRPQTKRNSIFKVSKSPIPFAVIKPQSQCCKSYLSSLKRQIPVPIVLYHDPWLTIRLLTLIFSAVEQCGIKASDLEGKPAFDVVFKKFVKWIGNLIKDVSQKNGNSYYPGIL